MEFIPSQFDDLRDPNDGGIKTVKINMESIAYYYPHRGRFTKIVLKGIAEPLVVNEDFDSFDAKLRGKDAV